MAAEDFDLEVDLPKFLEKLLDDTEKLFQSHFDLEAAEAHVEVVDQTIGLIRSLRECPSLDSRDKKNLASIITAFTTILSLSRTVKNNNGARPG